MANIAYMECLGVRLYKNKAARIEPFEESTTPIVYLKLIETHSLADIWAMQQNIICSDYVPCSG